MGTNSHGQDRLRAAYFRLVDDVVGYRALLEAEDLDRWLDNLDVMRGSIERAIVENELVPPDVFIGPWPDENLGARIHALDAGHLLLVNRGTASLADALARCCTMILEGYPVDATYHTLTLVEALWNGALNEEVVHAIPFRKERAQAIRVLSSFATSYPVCHEYGHVLLGHTKEHDVRGLLDVRRRWTSEGAVLWSRRLELEADRAALALLVSMYETDGSPGAIAGAQRYSVLAGVMVHALQALVIELPWSQDRFEIGDGHPPPLVRAAATVYAADELGLPDAAEAGRHYLDWVEIHALPAVRELIEERRQDE